MVCVKKKSELAIKTLCCGLGQFILFILNKNLCSFVDAFNECSLVHLIKINRLISKGTSNIYLKVTAEKK